MQALYERLDFPKDLADCVRADMRRVMEQETESVQLLRKQLKPKLRRLDTQEENLIDLAASGESAVAKVRARLAESFIREGSSGGTVTEHAHQAPQFWL